MCTSQKEIPKLRISQACYMAFFILILILILILGQFIFVHIAKTAKFCVLGAAQVISVQGVVELRRANNTTWQPVEPGMQLCADDQIRIRRHGRTVMRLINGSMLELDQKTTITLSQTQDNEATSLLDLFIGVPHIFTRTPKLIKVRSPFVNAGVEG